MSAALGIPLLAYSLVFGLFVVLLYWLLQPSRVSNPGLAAYVPLPGTVVSYETPARLLAQSGQAPPLAAGERAADETTGRSSRVAETAPEPTTTNVAAASERATAPQKPKRPKVRTQRRERSNPWGGYYAQAYWSYGWYRRY